MYIVRYVVVFRNFGQKVEKLSCSLVVIVPVDEEDELQGQD